jgi:hypothetical protein
MNKIDRIIAKKLLLMYSNKLEKDNPVYLNLFNTGIVLNLNKVQLSVIKRLVKDKKKNGKK